MECADHGTLSGSIDMKILPRPVTIAVEDSYKIASTADPEFTGAIVEGHLVQPSDLGAISFVRTNDTEEVGFYPEVLTANYLRNTNYDVQVVPGTFTIGPAGSTWCRRAIRSCRRVRAWARACRRGPRLRLMPLPAW